jgi:hypothetical protein
MPVFKVLILLIGFSRVARDGGFAGGGWLISTICVNRGSNTFVLYAFFTPSSLQ